jgi:predicted DCC family thiol-disulfide oxidoreductase YuxK
MPPSTKTLIYDDSCPLCSGYSHVFVKAGLLREDGRQSFDSVHPAFLQIVDLARCVDEIPLVDLQRKQVWYGVDALLEILGTRFPTLKNWCNVRPVKWMLWKAYRLISYNRRLILAVNTKTNGFDCTPAFNTRYRVAFMLLFLVVNTLLIVPLHQFVLTTGFFSQTALIQVVNAHTCIVLVNCSIALMLGKHAGINYLGQVNMLAITCFLFFLPLILLSYFTGWQNALLNDTWIVLASFVMIREYIRRMVYAQIVKTYPVVPIVNAISVLSMLYFLLIN